MARNQTLLKNGNGVGWMEDGNESLQVVACTTAWDLCNIISLTLKSLILNTVYEMNNINRFSKNHLLLHFTLGTG